MLVAALLAFHVVAVVGDTLEAVRFRGNSSFSSKVLATRVQLAKGQPVDEVRIVRDAADLENFYHDQGFYAVAVEWALARGRRRPVLTFVVNEGPRARVQRLIFQGNTAFDSSQLAAVIGLKPKTPATGGVGPAVENAVRVFYQNSGYAFVRVQTEVSRAESAATLNVLLAEGPLCVIDSVIFVGNRRVRAAVCRTIAELRAGDRYSRRRLLEAQRRLYGSKLFSRVSFRVVGDDSLLGRVVVRFDVVEQPFGSLGLGGGGELNPGRSPLRLLLAVDWEYVNLFGANHSLLASAEYAQQLIGPSFRFGSWAAWRIPYIGRSRVDFQTRPFGYVERRDSILVREYGVETGLSRSVLPSLVFSLANRLRLVADTSPGATSSLALSGQHDSRNDVFEPGRGMWVRGTAELAGGILGGSNDFYRLTVDIRAFRSLSRSPADPGESFVVAGRLGAGRVYPYRPGDLVAYYESFTMGGAANLRGYPDRSIGPFGDSTARYGFAMLYGSIELRSPYLFRLVGLVAFVDGGNLARYFPPRNFLFGAGVGLRVRTPIGPLRIDVARAMSAGAAGPGYGITYGLMHAF